MLVGWAREQTAEMVLWEALDRFLKVNAKAIPDRYLRYNGLVFVRLDAAEAETAVRPCPPEELYRLRAALDPAQRVWEAGVDAATRQEDEWMIQDQRQVCEHAIRLYETERRRFLIDEALDWAVPEEAGLYVEVRFGDLPALLLPRRAG